MASPIRLGGLVSGLDTQGIINQLLDVERLPITRLEAKQSQIQSKDSAFSDVKSQLDSLLSSVRTLNNVDTFRAMSTTSGDDYTLTGTAELGAAEAAYTVTINQKATRTVMQGASDIGSDIDPDAVISSAGFASSITAGYFTVNGQKITVETTDTVNTILAKITSIDTATYDAGNDRIQLSHSGVFNIGSAGDTSNFLSVMRLFGSGAASYNSNPDHLGTANIYQPINDGDNDARLQTTVTQTSSGAFSINGVSISYNTNTDSIKDVLRRINDSEAGVVATFDSVTDSVVLTSEDTGALDITVSDDSGNLMASLGLLSGTTKTMGDYASITIPEVNGGNPIYSNSNTFTEDVTGLTGVSINIIGSSGSTTLTIERDTNTFTDALDEFISQYNATHSLINTMTQVTSTGIAGDNVETGVLQGDSMLSAMQRRLRSLVGSTISGVNAPYNYLRGIGVWTSGQSPNLSIIDSEGLSSAMASNMGDIEELFTSDNGLASQLEDYIDGLTKSLTGAIASRQQGFTDQTTAIDKQIAIIQDRIDRKEKALVQQFTAMEVAVSQQQQQLSFLLSKLGISQGQ